jgi:hypothetical protein
MDPIGQLTLVQIIQVDVHFSLVSKFLVSTGH